MSEITSEFKEYDYIGLSVPMDIEIEIGVCKQIDLSIYRFERVDRVTYEGLPENGEFAIAEIVYPKQLTIVSSAFPDSGWLGKQLRCNVTVTGITFFDRERRIVVIPPFWHFLLMETARLINTGEYNLAIITSAIAFESFLSEFITTKLRAANGWSGLEDDQMLSRFKDKFLVGPDNLRINQKVQLFVKAWLGIQVDEIFQNWDSKVRSRRNTLVHAVSNRRYTLKDGLEALHATCCLIREILIQDSDEIFLNRSYMVDLESWVEQSEKKLQQLG